MRLEALLRAHGFMRTERPPALWEARTELERLVPLVGEMIAAALAGGGVLEQLTLAAANVAIEPPEEGDDGAQLPPPGEYVAISVRGATDLGPDARWLPGDSATGLLGRLGARLDAAGARWAYVRRLPGEGSITVLLDRAPQS